ncbi:putative peroxidase [Actinorhabdospora filicis]|uniref:Peroxidase n=1 Tax=Actinorhabdospora filicis TaxID=1785913 RepID=A0A9W6SGW6_9ACTN|nr:peroxidase family protein [Actinorhabdospora filicis]GLZ76068.1 putative peroxidase [Actinorhabdospora filicis]
MSVEDLLSGVFRRINRRYDWHQLPLPAALLNLDALRVDLRRENLHDTFAAGGERPRAAGTLCPYRSPDGSGYDAADVDMGRSGTRFDRNSPLAMTYPDEERLLTPSPREVSRALLRRERFLPATTLNLLAAAWIQFQNHDWFSHGDNHKASPIEVPLAAGDDWHESPMRVRRTRTDPLAHTDGSAPPTFENTVTHWWDGSQIYGSTAARLRELRAFEDGKLIVEGGRLPDETAPGLSGIDLTGFGDNYWVGLSLLHHLFVLEHNAICDRLRRHYPSWDDQRLFDTARLVNAAVMAKIHTVEWTPALLNCASLRVGMAANWWGVAGRYIREHYGRISSSEMISGILGSATEHHGAPFSMTEEFVTCYRLHPLIRDDYPVRSWRTGELLDTLGFDAVQAAATRPAVDAYGLPNLLYSFGTCHPGAITLHNHPNALRDLARLSGERVDLGAVDVLRDRERGVPRYRDFRRMLRMKPVDVFGDLSPDAATVSLIREVYGGDLSAVDTMIGMYAEPKPKGFAIADTSFRIFILMASRRLKSDRFFTVDYRPEIYTPEGLEWVDRTGMAEVLCRHFPELAPALDGVANPFFPWNGTPRP